MFKADTVHRYKRRYFKYQNYCRKYRLENILEEETFNKKFNDPKFRWVMMSKKSDKTKKFLKSIEQHIRNNSMIIIVIFGQPNSGKSEGAQTIALYWKSKFYLIRRKSIEIAIGTSTADMSSIFTEMSVGDITIRDESPKLSGAGSVNVQKYLDNITKIIRAAQNSFIFIDPVKIEADVVHFYLESAGKYISKRKTRFILYDSKHNLLGRIYLPLHLKKRFREQYEIRKHANIESLKANAGMVTPELNSKRLKRDIKILYDKCMEYGVTTKGEIYGLIPLYNSNIKKPENMIKGDTNYMKALLSNVFRQLKTGETGQYIKKKKIEIPIQSIRYQNGQQFSEFCRLNIKDNHLALVAEGLVRGDSYRTIADNYKKNFGYSFVQQAATLLRDVNNEYNLGFLFEKWYALNVGVPERKLGIVLAGNLTKPDLIWRGVIYSLKFRINTKSVSLKFKQSTDLKPEYDEAIRQNKKYKLVFMNSSWGQKIQIIDIDPIKDPDDIVVRKYKQPKIKKLKM